MNQSCLVGSHRTIDLDKLSTQYTCNFLRDSMIFKDTKHKIFEEISVEKFFEQMKQNVLSNPSNYALISETCLQERNSLFARLKKLSKQLRLSHQTLHLAFFYIDSIIAKNSKFVNISLDNIALGCLSLAIKFYESDENQTLPMLDELGVFFCNGTIKYDLNELSLVTPFSIVEFMIGHGIFFNDEQKLSNSSSSEKIYGDPVYKLAKDIIEYTLEACSCVSLVREIMEAETLWCDGLEGVYKMEFKEFDECFKYVKTKYYKVKNSKKGRDSSIGRKIKKNVDASEATCINSSEISKKEHPIIKEKKMTSSCKDLEPWNYDKSLQNYPHYIRIIKYPYIPKANNNDRNFNKIISPSANKTNFKTVTMTNKNLIPIAKEYSFQTQNTTRLGVPIPRGPNFNTSQYGLTSSHNMRIRNNSTIEKELIRKKLRAVREREKKLLEYQVYSSRIFQKTSSCDRYINNDSKYLDQFCNNSRVCSVGKSIEKKKVDRIFIKNEINCISNNKRKNTNKNIFQSKNESGVPSSNKHDNNLKTNNVIGKGNYTNLKPAKLTESKKNKLIPSAKNTVVSTNTNDKDNSQTLSKLPAKKELRSIYCKNILIYNSKKESFGTKSM